MCSPGPGNDYFNKESIKLYSSIYNSLAGIFRNVKPVVGNKLYFIASDKDLSVSFCKLTEMRNISNIYVSSDFLADDLALIINTEFGLVVILGCAHRGIINTLRHAQNLTGQKLVYTVIGGTHLFRASEERLAKTIAELKEMGIQRLGVSHCTGFHASARLAQEFKDAFFLNNTGTRLTLP